MPVYRFQVKRLRKKLNSRGQPTGDQHWVSLGQCFVNTDENSGAIMLNDRDEVWRLFVKTEKGANDGRPPRT